MSELRPTAFPGALFIGLISMFLAHIIPNGMNDIQGFFVGFFISLVLIACMLTYTEIKNGST